LEDAQNRRKTGQARPFCGAKSANATGNPGIYAPPHDPAQQRPRFIFPDAFALETGKPQTVLSLITRLRRRQFERLYPRFSYIAFSCIVTKAVARSLSHPLQQFAAQFPSIRVTTGFSIHILCGHI
jgi:hypothetical protein